MPSNPNVKPTKKAQCPQNTAKKARVPKYKFRHTLFFYAGAAYLVTRSSQRTIDSMTSIERPQAATNTVQVLHMGVWT